jgi:hypothetical protein
MLGLVSCFVAAGGNLSIDQVAVGWYAPPGVSNFSKNL